MTAPVRGLSACHNHTQMSDGALELDGMVRAAVRRGFSDIGISDHSCLAAEPPHATGDEAGYIAALRGAKARFAGEICVAAGLELDALSRFQPGKNWITSSARCTTCTTRPQTASMG